MNKKLLLLALSLFVFKQNYTSESYSSYSATSSSSSSYTSYCSCISCEENRETERSSNKPIINKLNRAYKNAKTETERIIFKCMIAELSLKHPSIIENLYQALINECRTNGMKKNRIKAVISNIHNKITLLENGIPAKNIITRGRSKFRDIKRPARRRRAPSRPRPKKKKIKAKNKQRALRK